MSTPLHLLIVEDSEDDAKLIVQCLEQADFEVRFEQVQDAAPLSAALLNRSWDAVVSDYSMPRFNGIKALELVRAAGLDIPFILTSGAIGEDTAVVAMKAGANDCVMKDNLARLAPAMRRELQEAARRAEHRRAEIELKKLSVAVRQSGIGIVITDPDGIIEFVNPGFEKMSGYAAAELIGRNPRFLKSGLTPTEVYRDLWDTVTAGREWRGELQNRRKNGELYTEIQHISPVLDDEGAILNFIVVKDDVTAQRRDQDDLLRLRMAMDVSQDSIYLTNSESLKFVYVNEAACKRVGYPRDQLLKMGPAGVLNVDPEQIRREFETVLAAGDKGTSGEHRFARQDGTTGWTELRRRALHTKDGVMVVSIGRDITERKESDLKIRRLNRVYAVLSGINGAIVRVRDRDELFREACRIAVEDGKFIAAFVTVADADKQHLIPISSWQLAPDLMEKMRFRLSLRDDAPEGHGPATTAFREKRAVFVNDVQTDPRIIRKKEHAAYGISAVAMLPLFLSGSPMGVLALYASEPDFFDDEEIKLLTELAGDVSFALDHIAKESRLKYLALYDPLTGIANRTLLLERLAQSILTTGPDGGKIAIVIADIERFRGVNESMGRVAGDEVIREFARRMTEAEGPAAVARLETDRFAILLQDVKGKSEVTRRVEQLWQKCMGAPFCVSGAELRLGLRGGVAIFPNDGANAEVLLGYAEAALARAKSLGEKYYFHTPELTARAGARLTLENKLRQALEKQEFVLHYQPKVTLDTRRIVGVEALIRWQSPELGLVPPGDFIPLMEQTGLILDAGAWALGQAVRDHARWISLGLPAPRVAVNVSSIQLRRRDFVATVEAALAVGGKPPGIDLEITESMIMEDIGDNMRKLSEVRSLGLDISIDDFGTGYSSLAYLTKLPVQTIKIDRSFIITMLKDTDTMTLVRMIISLAHDLKRTVVAEGVDAEEQASVLWLLRCDQMQGYLFSRPVPFDQLSLKLEKQEPPIPSTT